MRKAIVVGMTTAALAASAAAAGAAAAETPTSVPPKGPEQGCVYSTFSAPPENTPPSPSCTKPA